MCVSVHEKIKGDKDDRMQANARKMKALHYYKNEHLRNSLSVLENTSATKASIIIRERVREKNVFIIMMYV